MEAEAGWWVWGGGGAEMRRLHFYEWGGLRVLVRRRGGQIFMNEKKWGKRAVCARACVRKRWGGRGLVGHKGNVRAD